MNKSKLSSFQKVILGFCIITAVLISIHWLNLFLIKVHYLSERSMLFKLFDLNKEKNIPSIFSSFGLIFTSGILAYILFRDISKRKYYWLLLSIIFLFMSIDELISIHEHFDSLRTTFNVSGFLFFTWIIPYGIAVIFVALIFYKFLMDLPVITKRLIILSGIIYIIGSIGFEAFSAKEYVENSGVRTITYRILYSIEESLEMTSIVLFIYALFDYRIRINKQEPETKKVIITS